MRSDDQAPDRRSASRPRRKYRSSEENIASILEAALEEFKSKGFERSTTAGIARRARVVEPQIFQYFRSKSNLFRTAIFETLNRQLDAVSHEFRWEDDGGTGMPDPLGEVIHTDRLQGFLAENIDLIKALFVANAYGAFDTPSIGVDDGLARYFDHGAAIMNRHWEGGPGVPPRIMVRISFGAVLGCVLFRDWLFPQGMAPETELTSAITKFVLAGLKATTDPRHVA